MICKKKKDQDLDRLYLEIDEALTREKFFHLLELKYEAGLVELKEWEKYEKKRAFVRSSYLRCNSLICNTPLKTRVIKIEESSLFKNLCDFLNQNYTKNNNYQHSSGKMVRRKSPSYFIRTGPEGLDIKKVYDPYFKKTGYLRNSCLPEKILNDLKKYKQNKADKKLDYSFILVGHNEKGNHMQCLVSFYWPDFFYHIEGCRLDEEEGEVLDADEVVYDDRILEIIDEFINF